MEAQTGSLQITGRSEVLDLGARKLPGPQKYVGVDQNYGPLSVL